MISLSCENKSFVLILPVPSSVGIGPASGVAIGTAVDDEVTREITKI